MDDESDNCGTKIDKQAEGQTCAAREETGLQEPGRGRQEQSNDEMNEADSQLGLDLILSFTLLVYFGLNFSSISVLFLSLAHERSAFPLRVSHLHVMFFPLLLLLFFCYLLFLCCTLFSVSESVRPGLRFDLCAVSHT